MVVLQQATVYQFETEDLVGTIRPGHEFPHHGVTRLRHKRTGIEFVHPLYSLLNVFRIMGVDPQKGQPLGEGLGDPRQEAHTVEVADNAVTLGWPPTERRRVGTRLRYTIEEPNRIDLTVSVRAEAAYGAYEVLLASYHNPLLRPYAYLARDRFELTDEPGRFTDEAEPVPLVVNAAIRGGILIFPRDPAAARIFADGRWDAVARFSPVRRYKVPVCCQTDPERRVAAVWMARPEDCFAVGSAYDSPDTRDRFKQNNPQYLSLFGADLRPGEERTARTRLIVSDLDEAMSQPLALFQAFLAE